VLSGSVGAVEALGIDARWDRCLSSWIERFGSKRIHLANCPFVWNDVSPFGQNTKSLKPLCFIYLSIICKSQIGTIWLVVPSGKLT
jgi:hypothetical protein